MSMENIMKVKARRGSRQPKSLFLPFEVHGTKQTTNERGRIISRMLDDVLRETRCCIAEMSADDIEAFRQKKLDVSHVLVSRGSPKAKRLDMLCLKRDPSRKFLVESVDNPAEWGEWTLYYCKEQ